MLDTGARPKEAFSLRMADFNMQSTEVRITSEVSKTGVSRTLPLSLKPIPRPSYRFQLAQAEVAEFTVQPNYKFRSLAAIIESMTSNLVNPARSSSSGPTELDPLSRRDSEE